MIRQSTQYYMLISSLPHLPRIGRADRLPINEPRLEGRLRMLNPEDAEVVARLRRFIHWQNRSLDQTDADIAAQYRDLLDKNPHPAVRAAIEFRMDLRTVLAALRRRHRGEEDPPPDHEWGVGRWVRHIEANWSHPDFKLSHVFPWIPDARQFLENGEAIKLQELTVNLVWETLDRSAAGKYFGLEAVIAFIFKWDILRRWLSYKEDAARTKFEELAATLFPGESSTPPATSP